MPYEIRESEGKYQVVNSDTDEVKGEHPSRAKAEAQMRALYSNEPAKHMKVGRRNSNSDLAKLQNIRSIVEELIGAEMGEDEAEEVAGKAADLSYVKSIGVEENVWAVKSIGDGIIRGYVALWGTPDKTDLELEYFTKDTDFWDGQIKSARPLTWDHAQDKEFKGNPVIGTITEMGDDEVGRWYVAKLDRAHRYNKAIEELIKAGKLGTSSDSAPQYVERVKTGKAVWLKTWPLFAAALTDTPAEPRMVGSLEYLKSLGVDLPDNHERDWQWASARMKRNRY